MSSPGKRQTSVSHKGALTRQKSGEGDPWCLTCGVNLRVDGGTFSVLSKHNTGDLCDIFSRVLGAELSEGYASINMCNRCERQLRRLGRYNSIILARNEGKKLRDQLEKNLAKYGQKVVESGDIHDLDTSGVSQAGSNVAANSPGYSPKKGKISEGSVGRARPAVASRPSSTGSVPASKSIDISGASHALRNGSGVGARRSSGPGPLLEKKKPSSPFEEVEKRLEARRRKWSNASSTSEDSLTNTATEDPKVPADKKAGGTSSHQHRSVSFQDDVVSKDAPVKQTPQLTSSVLSEEPGDDADEMETNDKKTLVERSESLDQDYRRDVYKKKGKFTFGFRSAGDGGNKTSKRVTSPTNDEPPQASVGGVNTSPAETASPVHWSGRINPFDVEAEKEKAAGSFEFASSLDDDVFVKGIIDLDDVSSTKHKHDNASVGRGSVQTMDSERIRHDLMTDLDSKTFKDFSRASSTSLDDTEPEVDPSGYNTDNRSSLSEVEERINIKSQFKGAYYNIGSTEDLLQDLENELAAERAKASKLTPINSIDKEDGLAQTKLPRLVKPAEVVSRGSAEGQQKKKGKVLKYESLDLDIEQSNPFFDDVYGEYDRRIKAKQSSAGAGKRSTSGVAGGGGSGGSSCGNPPRTKLRRPRQPETIPEVVSVSVDETDQSSIQGGSIEYRTLERPLIMPEIEPILTDAADRSTVQPRDIENITPQRPPLIPEVEPFSADATDNRSTIQPGDIENRTLELPPSVLEIELVSTRVNDTSTIQNEASDEIPLEQPVAILERDHNSTDDDRSKRLDDALEVHHTDPGSLPTQAVSISMSGTEVSSNSNHIPDQDGPPNGQVDENGAQEAENNGQDYTPLIDTKDDETQHGDKISDQGPHDVTEVETSFNEAVGKESIVDDVNGAEVVGELVVTPRQELEQEDDEVAEVATVSNAVITETTLEKSIQDEIDEQPMGQPEEQPEVYDGDDEKTDGRDQLEDMQNLPSEGAPLTKKSEKSPLISSDLKVKGGKDGKFNDHQPGFLCCTIL